jgi:hypothetical protein
MPPTPEQFEAALAEIEEDTAMPPGMTPQQYADAREMMENIEDVEFYEAMTEEEYEQLKSQFLAIEGAKILEEFNEKPVEVWDYIGAMHEYRFQTYAVKAMREKYRTSGELLDCVREAVMGVEA